MAQVAAKVAGASRVDPGGVWGVQGPLLERISGPGALRPRRRGQPLGNFSQPKNEQKTIKLAGASRGLQEPPGASKRLQGPGGSQAPRASGGSFRGLVSRKGSSAFSGTCRGLHSFRACHFTHPHQKIARPLSASENLQRTQMKKCCC